MISFSQLPTPVRIGGAATGVVGLSALSGLSFGRLGLSGGVWVIMAVTFVTLLLLLLTFWICYRFWRKRKGDALSKLLRKDAGSVELSGIESMRTNFENGVEKLRKAGRNVYDLPWFLLAGQAGAGKTEAIRRSHAKEDFPPGLNDLMQGVGGTLNMNWWFTNKGIILDTAGRIFEERVKQGQSNEWQEFLKMLKKARKNMPINGFILAIPADSLIRDDFAKIEEKASHIAEQITLVQNVLGVRFPVFIIITKADYIPGFREFVENITEPSLQQQMLGWSNPSGLDDPFEAENVEHYLDDVIKKLKKRRLTYLLDPRPHNEKRLDDLDALFTFPNQLRAALPNLKRYIEIVFSLNPWTQKPLFIRGIYFTSSLQQGDALDEALANVMGKNLKDMALSSFKKEIPLFLRDVFFQKIYREQGLVTTATKVKGAMRRNTFFFAGACLVGISLILAAAWFGSRSFRSSIGDEYAHWKFAEQEYHESELVAGQTVWTRPIVYDTGVGDAFASDKDVSFRVAASEYTLPQYISQMSQMTQTDLEVPGVFRPLKFFDDMLTGDSLDRESAFRRLFEDAVVLPVIINAREKLRAATDMTWNARGVRGLHSLIQLQVLLNQTDRDSDYTEKFWSELNALFVYLTDDQLGKDLEKAYKDFFDAEYLRKSAWPSEEFSPHYAAVDDINDSRLAAISHGLGLWVNEIGELRVQQEENMKRLAGHLEELERIGEIENRFLSESVKLGNLESAAVNGLSVQYRTFIQSISELDDVGSKFTFNGYYQEQINAAKRSVEQQVSVLSAQVKDMPGDGGALSRAVLERVDQQRQELLDSFDRIVNENLLKRFGEADSSFLGATQGLEKRLAFYRGLISYRKELERTELNTWSEGAQTMSTMQAMHTDLYKQVVSYNGHQKEGLNEFMKLAEQYLSSATKRIYDDYCTLVRNDIRQSIGFPIIADSQRILSFEELDSLKGNMTDISADIVKLKQILPGTETLQLDSIAASLQSVQEFYHLLLSSGALDGDMVLTFPGLEEISNDISDTIAWRARVVQVPEAGPPVRMGGRSVELGKLKLSSQNMEIVFTSSVDGESGDVAKFSLRGGWAPLQLLLRSSGSVKEVAGKYSYRGRASVQGLGHGYIFELQTECSNPLPQLDAWLRNRDLKGL